MNEQNTPSASPDFSHEVFKAHHDSGRVLLKKIADVVHQHRDCRFITTHDKPPTGFYLRDGFGFECEPELLTNTICLLSKQPQAVKKLEEYLHHRGFETKVYIDDKSGCVSPTHSVDVYNAVSLKFVEDLDRGLALMKETQASRAQTAAAR